MIDAAAAKLYTKKVKGVAVEKGVAFPVCISVNDVICNRSPLGSEDAVSAARVRAAPLPPGGAGGRAGVGQTGLSRRTVISLFLVFRLKKLCVRTRRPALLPTNDPYK